MSNEAKIQMDELLKKIQVSGSFDSALYARQLSQLADSVDISGPSLSAAQEEQVLKLIMQLKATAPNLSIKAARDIAVREVLATKEP